MNEADIFAHLQTHAAPTEPLCHGRLSSRDVAISELFSRDRGIGGLGQRILDALKDLIGTTGLDVETVVAAAKSYFETFTSGDNPSIPNFLESLLESLAWAAIERAIRRMFANAPMA